MLTPVELNADAQTVAAMRDILRSWTFDEHPVPPPGAKQPIVFARADDRYILSSRWLDKPVERRDPVDAICALIIELVWGYLEDHPQTLCLHGAAAEFAGRLVVFPNQYRAGKSLLAGCLAAAGQMVFADDILPVAVAPDSNVITGLATGVAPRLRLPLPGNLSATTRAFLDARSGPRSQRYLYLDLPDGLQAARNRHAPIGAFVLLQRNEDGETSLEEVGQAEMLRSVVWQNFARHMPSGEILRTLQALVSNTGCYRLHYSAADDAAAFLRERFSAWQAPPAVIEPRNDAERALLPQPPVQARPAGRLAAYRQTPGVFEHAEGDEHFLADASGMAIHHLNPTAAAVWRVLAEPMTRQQVIDLFQAGFPDQPADEIARDIGQLLDELKNKHLLQYDAPVQVSMPTGPARQSGGQAALKSRQTQ